jgi:hypothetical protein
MARILIIVGLIGDAVKSEGFCMLCDGRRRAFASLFFHCIAMYFVIQSTAMHIPDLVFLIAVLTSAVSLSIMAVSAIGGHGRRALKLLAYYSTGGILYVLLGLTVALLKPQHVLRAGDPWCFDDWCLTVEDVTRAPNQADTRYQVGLRVFSEARRVSQRAKGAWIYLIDERGRRFSPEPDASAVPLDIPLEPHESVVTSRTFHVPNDASRLGLITGHGGPYCGPMSFLVIGESGCLFHKPTMVRIQ